MREFFCASDGLLLACCQFCGGAQQALKGFVPARIKMLVGAKLIYQAAFVENNHSVAETENRSHVVRHVEQRQAKTVFQIFQQIL